jgi:hypothetical protein
MANIGAYVTIEKQEKGDLGKIQSSFVTTLLKGKEFSP